MSALLSVTAAFAFPILLVGALFYWMPRLTRPDLYFAVTVPSGFRDTAEGRQIMRRYRLQIALSSLGALGLVAVGGWRGWTLLMAAAILVQLGGFYPTFLAARNRVKPHRGQPSSVREASLFSRSAHLPGGWPAQAGPFVLLAVAALYLNRRWADIPPRFPIHWGLNGHADNFATRTPAGVYGTLVMGALMCLLFGGLAYALLRWSRPVRRGGAPGVAEEGFRRSTVGVLVATQWFLAILLGWISVSSPFASPAHDPPGAWAVVGLIIAFVAGVIVVFVRKGQGGTRTMQTASASILGLEEEGRPVGDRTADRYWKAGMFYVNRDDPAIFVEKRFGIGYTVNFGRRLAWAILAALPLVVLAVLLVTHMMGK